MPKMALTRSSVVCTHTEDLHSMERSLVICSIQTLFSLPHSCSTPALARTFLVSAQSAESVDHSLRDLYCMWRTPHIRRCVPLPVLISIMQIVSSGGSYRISWTICKSLPFGAANVDRPNTVRPVECRHICWVRPIPIICVMITLHKDGYTVIITLQNFASTLLTLKWRCRTGSGTNDSSTCLKVFVRLKPISLETSLLRMADSLRSI